MKTFEFTVKNLGPIKSATFSSSHLNVLCGKNNSGKSFLIHAVYCILRHLQSVIKINPNKDLVDKLMSDGRCELKTNEYLSNLNSLIADALPDIVSRLSVMMNKSEAAFRDCEIKMCVSEEYAVEFLRRTPISLAFQLSKNLNVQVKKTEYSDVCSIEIQNGAETYPSKDMLQKVLSFILRQIVGKVLPVPVLLTAERSGIVAFAADLMSYAVSKQGDSTPFGAVVALTEHYPTAITQELILQNEIKQTREDKSYLMANIAIAERFYRWFKEHVMDGDVVAREGKLYYLQSSNQLEMPFSDASSSVKALASLNFFVHYMMKPGAILMIDEPELNLHPERQRVLMRAFARMVNEFGVGIVLSTHSVTMVRELNTLLAFKTIGDNAEVLAKSHGYDTDEFLCEDDVSCGIVEDGTINQIKKGLQTKGFFVQSFDDTNDAIATVQSDIISLWE